MVAGVTATVTSLSLLGGGYAYLGATDATSGQSIESGTVSLAIEGPGGTAEFEEPVTGLAAGDAVVRYADVVNRGTLDLVDLSARQESGGPLVADALGLDVQVQSCSEAWVDDSCSDASVLVGTDLSAWATRSLALPGLELAAGETSHLRFLTRLDPDAPNALQGQRASITYTIAGVEGDLSPEVAPVSAAYSGDSTVTSGEELTGSVTGSGGSGTLTYRLVGAPAWLTLTEDGVLSGVAGRAGTYSFAIEAVDGVGRVGSTPVEVTVTAGAAATVAAPAVVAGDASASLTWAAPSSDGGSAVTGYRVRGSDGVVREAPASPRSLVVSGLVNGSTYSFAVASVTAVGVSPYGPSSASVRPMPAAALTVSAPDASVAYGSALTGSVTSANAASGVSYSVTGAPSWLTLDTATGALGGVASAAGTSTPTVRATDGLGRTATSTFTLTATAVTPAAVTGATLARVSENSLALSWDPSPAGDLAEVYDVLRGGEVVASVPASTTSYTDTGLSAGSAYTYAVRARNASATGPAGAPVTSYPTSGVVSALTVGSSTAAGTDLSWTAVPGATGYRVSYSTPGGVSATRDVGAAVTSTTLTGLTEGAAYTATVTALRADSPAGASASLTTGRTPAAVTGATLTPASDTSLRLAWTASPGAEAVTSYEVLRDGRVLASVPAGATSYLDSGLAAGTPYSYEVRAVSAWATGAASAPVSAYASSGVVSALTVVSSSAAGTDLSWSPVPGATGYRVSRSSGGAPALEREVGPGATSATLTDLAPGTAYTITVTALRSDAPAGATVLLTTGVTPAAVAGTTLVRASDTSLRLNWTDSPASERVTAYEVLRGGVVVATVPAGTSTHLDTGLSPDASYSYTVRARSSWATGPSGASVSAYPSSGTVTGLTVGTPTAAGGAALSWNPVPGATGYRVAYSTGGGAAVTRDVGSAATSATLTGLAERSTYSVTVTALRADSPASASASFTTGATPAAVTGATLVRVDDTSLRLNWTDSPAADGVTSYEVLRGGAVVATVPAGTHTLLDTGLSPGASYSYAVRARSSWATGAASSTVSAYPSTGVVTGLSTGTPTETATTLSWTAVPGATGYRVTSSPTGGATTSTEVTGTAASLTGLTGATTYVVTVTALRPDSPSGASASFTTATAAMAWSTLASVPTARYGASSESIGDVVYVIGGQTSASSAVNTVQAYDTRTGAWTTKAPMASVRSYFSTAVVNGLIYAIGGYNPATSSGLNTVQSYNPATNTWTSRASMPTDQYAHSSAVVNGVIYVIGGSRANTQAYNVAANTWSTVAPVPTRGFYAGSAVVNGVVYTVGGLGPSSGAVMSNVQAYNPATNTWAARAAMPTARYGLGVSVVDGSILAVGGFATAATGVVEAYDPVANTWSARASMPSPRYYLTTSVVSGSLYAAAGYSQATGAPAATMQRFGY